MKQLIVGLTGGIGSGKTFVSLLFAELGINIINVDHIAKDILKIKDKQKMLKKLFDPVNGKEERRKIEKEYYPKIYKEINKRIKSFEGPYILVDMPLLYEQNINYDYSIIVDCPVELQIARAIRRDPSIEEYIHEIINSQMNRNDRLSKCDFVINNNMPSLEAVKKQVAAIDLFLLCHK